MKQTVTIFRNFSLVILSFSLFLASCSKKDKDASGPEAAFAGQYTVAEEDETYILTIQNKGGNNFQISNFGGFLNAPLKAVANGTSLTIPSQTFTNPNGHTLTVVGTGVLKTVSTQDDTVQFNYSVSGFADYSGSLTAKRK